MNKEGEIMQSVRYIPISESALIVEFSDTIDLHLNNRILQLSKNLVNNPFPGFIEAVPAYTTITIHFDPVKMKENPYDQIISVIDHYLTRSTKDVRRKKTVKIPVCYEEEFGLDLDIVASHNQLTREQVIDIHTAKIYDVYFLGFSPGFPFLGGMDPRIATPRKKTPRLQLPAGSVGIAGSQTGVYPSTTPGGWQIIGRTPVKLLQLENPSPTLLQPGDRVQFYSISREDFFNQKQEDVTWDYES
ncbi:5-oxoprolinase subunit PxpB [Aquibacillus albus]|uniref:Inhibitor of KinA n=1 Tax=Aquibacillus albus TaxID=1168171 RepID=A0ABS2MWV7_9BACI|nr:5-oxoprolinase subunit PxpB [Aquibacillus albus]MBM7570273.1 inhibitor of KinA [Aquibacillus albus]